MVLQSWRKGDRLIPPPADDAVRSAARHIGTCLNSWAESADPAALAEASRSASGSGPSPRSPTPTRSAGHSSWASSRWPMRTGTTRACKRTISTRALALLQEAVELAPRGSEARSDALLNLGTLLGSSGAALGEPGAAPLAGSPGAAIDEMDAADPDRPLALRNLANAIDDLTSLDPHRQDEAITMGEHALSVTPDLHVHTWAHRRSGRHAAPQGPAFPARLGRCRVG